MNLFGDIAGGAHFDDTRTNRYCLWRQWDSNKPYLMVIGLNPSTANEHTDDHTIKRIQGIAKFNDYGGIYMTNLFSYISTDPKKLVVDTDPDYNYRILACYAFMSKAVCFA